MSCQSGCYDSENPAWICDGNHGRRAGTTIVGRHVVPTRSSARPVMRAPVRGEATYLLLGDDATTSPTPTYPVLPRSYTEFCLQERHRAEARGALRAAVEDLARAALHDVPGPKTRRDIGAYGSLLV